MGGGDADRVALVSDCVVEKSSVYWVAVGVRVLSVCVWVSVRVCVESLYVLVESLWVSVDSVSVCIESSLSSIGLDTDFSDASAVISFSGLFTSCT